MMHRSIQVLIVSLNLAGVVCPQEWHHYGGDAGGQKYSPLKQIHKRNVTQLRVAWEYDTGDVSDRSVYPVYSTFEATPLVIDGVMYLSTGFHRLLALDAETGRLL
jgi:quinoprotein glucose dehydrogenase